MPFNRALRERVYRGTKNEDNTIPFGSPRDLSPASCTSFVNCPFPALDVDAAETQLLIIGPDCRYPFDAKVFLIYQVLVTGPSPR